MFDTGMLGVGLWPGEGPEGASDRLAGEDDLAFEVACGDLVDGWVAEEQHFLPDGLESIPPGPFLAAVVSSVDPARLNGHDAVRLMQAEARLESHAAAGKLAAIAEVAFAPPGNADSPVERTPNAVEYGCVEVAAGLTLTRRASETLLDVALSLKHRLFRVWKALQIGKIDLAGVRVFDQTLGHLPGDIVDMVLDGSWQMREI